MKIYLKILFGILIIIILILLLFKVDIKIIDMKLEIGDKIGLNVDNNTINFGIISPGGSSKKSMIINEKGFVNMGIEGDIKKFIVISRNNQFMNNEEISLVATNIPENENGKEYNGKLIIRVIKWRIN